MAVLDDELASAFLDEALTPIYDEMGLPLDARDTMSFQAHSAVTAQATMEFEAGQPVQAGMTTLATDPWFSMYPG
jgi:hypothetical protein